MDKSLHYILLTLVCLCITQKTFAAQSHWSTTAGVSYYDFNAPPFQYGSQESSSKPRINLKTEAQAIKPELTITYRLLDKPEMRFFTYHPSLSFSISGFSDKETRRREFPTNLLDLDVLHPIDGSQMSVTGAFNQVTLKTHHTVGHLDMLYHFNDSDDVSVSTLQPFVGLTFTTLQQKNDLRIVDTSGTPLLNTLNEKIKSYYLGATLGSKLNMPLGSHFALFIKGAAEAAYVHSMFDGKQFIEAATPRQNFSASDKDQRISYRGIAAAGFNVYFSSVPNHDRAKLTAEVGVDYWNNLPKVVNPSQNGKRARLSQSSRASHYFALRASIPF